MAQAVDNRLKPLRKLHDLDVVRELERTAAERRTHTETFIDLVSKELINHRVEAKAWKIASQANAEYEYFVAEVGAASRVIGSVDKNLADAIKTHCTHVTDEYSADNIRLQLAKNKYNARKCVFEAQPVIKRVFAKSPRAKKNEIFSEKVSTVTKPKRKKRSVPRKNAVAAKETSAQSSCWCFVPLFYLCCLIVGFGCAITITGRERVSERLADFSTRAKTKVATIQARVGESEGSRFSAYSNAMSLLCADVVKDFDRSFGAFDYAPYGSTTKSGFTALQRSGAKVLSKLRAYLKNKTASGDKEEEEEAELDHFSERSAVSSSIDECSAGQEL